MLSREGRVAPAAQDLGLLDPVLLRNPSARAEHLLEVFHVLRRPRRDLDVAMDAAAFSAAARPASMLPMRCRFSCSGFAAGLIGTATRARSMANAAREDTSGRLAGWGAGAGAAAADVPAAVSVPSRLASQRPG